MSFSPPQGALEQQGDRRAWLRLWHARVSYVLTHAAVPHILIKGETYVEPLVLEFTSADVDVLVRPEDATAARAALATIGIVPLHPGAEWHEVAWHASTLKAADSPAVDLHIEYPGLDTDPGQTWDVLARQSTFTCIAGRPLPVLDLPAQVLLTAASAARDGAGSGAAVRMAAAAKGCDADVWVAVAGLAAELMASGVLRAGLEAAGHAQVADRLNLPTVPRRWRLVAIAAPVEARQLEAILALPWRMRWPVLRRELLPTRAFMAVVDPRSTRGPVQLLLAHGRRYRQLAVRLPATIRAIRDSRD